jgi:chromosome segregation ATPase
LSLELNKTGNAKLQEEIDLAINNLEKEIAISQNQLTALEEKLVERYLELDANMLSYEVHEYEEILNNLEHERIELEEEKVKLQEHFATKLSSIKQVYLPGAFPTMPFSSTDNEQLKQSLPITPIDSSTKKLMKNSVSIKNKFVDKEKCEKGYIHIFILFLL